MTRPTEAQIRAADPAVSAWVTANAGSGKTRVLTQRVARLLLAGTPPERILCLTYTKAAAAEMQSRLFETLGGWALAGDARLGAELAALEGGETPLDDPARLAAARRLFALALETPGGLRIQTIHAFCDAVLRRFPLEAGVSPRFEVIDEAEAAEMLARLRGDLAAEAEADGGGPFDRVAARLNEDDIDALITAILARRHDFDGPVIEDRLRAAFGPLAQMTPEEIARDDLSALDAAALSAHAEVLERVGGKKGAPVAEGLRAGLAAAAGDPLAAARSIARGYLTGTGKRRSRHQFPVNAVLAADPGADALTNRMIGWAEALEDRLRTLETAARARDLHAFAHALLARYGEAKRARALLDFDDLVTRTEALLADPGLRAWVLYKLDAGIGHILVDEAQDTAPAQWRIVAALAEEFWTDPQAGRSLFVVGDEKQSIYSFQGAAPEAFAEMRTTFATALERAGRRLAAPDLVTSFRSAPGVLDFVDTVFAVEDHGLTGTPGAVRHAAHRQGEPARVDLWELIKPAGKADPGPWEAPVDAPPPDSPALRLARRLAGEIARMLREDSLPPRDGKPARPVGPGDILVLVRQRGPLDAALIRELKARGVRVAGADRLKLHQALAARDLLAAVRASLLPGDDLSLAEVLRSPLCDVGETALFELAHGRAETLWAALAGAAERHSREAAMMADLARRADYLRPYEFLERILLHHDGQRRLLARLGPESAEVIDALLAEALAFEARAVPTLAGFVAHVEQGAIEVKREQDRSAGALRVMTVHGAKGLEAPVVILPDTMRRPPGARGPHLVATPRAEGLTLWLGGAVGDDAVAEEARKAAANRAAAERQRLLYVALTRAEDWLILCGAGKADDMDKDGRWYGPLAGAMARLAPRQVPGPEGTTICRLGPDPEPRPRTDPGAAMATGDGATAPEAAAQPAAPGPAEADPAPPDWLAPAPREPRPRRLAPSSLPGTGGTPDTGGGRDREAALAHGRAVHLLLERLGAAPGAVRAGGAEPLLRAAEPGLDAAARAAALAEAEAALALPEAAALFGPGSLAEVGLALPLPEPGAPAMIGRADRLLIAPDQVTVVDFKTDAAPPATPAGVPRAYLAQLGAYARALSGVYPGRRIVAALLWTAAPRLMPLESGRMEDALEAALAAS